MDSSNSSLPDKNPVDAINLEALMEKLRASPNLIPLVDQMLDLAHDTSPDKPTAHQAEDQAVTLMQDLGQRILSDWSQNAHDHAKDEARRLCEDLVNHREKNSSGTAASERSD